MYFSSKKVNGIPNPDDLTFHRQIKVLSEKMKPDLMRLRENLSDKTANVALYTTVKEELLIIKMEVTNHDTLCAFHAAISQLDKAIELANKNAVNEDILWRLQEVMAYLFKIQNLPS